MEQYIPYLLYASAIIAFFLAVFWRPIVGILYLLPLIPLQTLRYRINDFPLGASIFGVMLLGIAFGLKRSGQPVLSSTPWLKLIGIYALFTFASLCMGSFYLGISLPIPGDVRFGAWQEYMIMPALLLLTAAVIRTKRQIQLVILIICVGTLLLDKSFWNTVSGRDFSAYTEELHEEGGGMGYAGSNGLAAFTAQVSAFLLALAGVERSFWKRAGYYCLAAYSAVCLMYSLSRGGYLAFLASCFVIGLLKQHKLLVVLLAFLFTWTTLVPPAVQQRVQMTYDQQTGGYDHSSETRLSLWTNALEVFNTNAALGTGFGTYEYMHLNKMSDGGYYADTHNYFVKVIVETGVVGLLLLLWLLGKIFSDGYRLFRNSQDPFFASLGLGIVGWLVAAVVANLFGDRWTFLQVNGYMWVIVGLVYRANELDRETYSDQSVALAPIQASERDLNIVEHLPDTHTPPPYRQIKNWEPSATSPHWDQPKYD